VATQSEMGSPIGFSASRGGMAATILLLPPPIILFANVDVSRHILVIDTFILVKSNMGRKEY
jgi:hypothetical protein